MIQNKKFQKIVFDKINADLSDKIYHPVGQEIWILDPETQQWYFCYHNSGRLEYNGVFFKNYFDIFSLNSQDSQKILNIWFQKTLDISVRMISRRNTDFSWSINKVIKASGKKWSIINRFGFSYKVVKKYLDLIRDTQEENLRLKHLFGDNYSR